MKNVRVAIEQDLHIAACNHAFHDVITLANQNAEGVAAKHETKVLREIDVDLSTIRFNAPTNHSKGGVEIPLSIEEIFQLSQLQPVCHGKIVRNEYFIAVRTAFEGCTCCSATPIVKIPLVILPTYNPAVFGFQQPQDFKPQAQPLMNINLIPESQLQQHLDQAPSNSSH